MRATTFLACLLSTILAFSQGEKQNSKFSIRGTIGIPRTISSKMFKTAFNGVYEGNLSGNVRVFTNFFAGLGYQNTHFQNNKGVFVFYQSSQGSLSYNTRLTGQGGFIKLGYDKFFDKGYVSYSLNSGVMAFSYTNINADTSALNKPYGAVKFTAPFLQPEIAVNFIADGLLSFSLILSYTTAFYTFDPRAPRFNQIAEVNSKPNKHPMSWINIGFGFNVLLGK